MGNGSIGTAGSLTFDPRRARARARARYRRMKEQDADWKSKAGEVSVVALAAAITSDCPICGKIIEIGDEIRRPGGVTRHRGC